MDLLKLLGMLYIALILEAIVTRLDTIITILM